MLDWLKRNAQLRRIGQQLYESIVAAARREVFFRDMGIPDTMEGRFESIVLHLFIVLERLKREGEPGQRVGQTVLECLVADMDDALRQIGIGDMGVPRRVKRAAAAIRERLQDYGDGAREGLAAGDELERALLRHVYGHESGAAAPATMAQVAALAAYARAAVLALDGHSTEALYRDGPAFPDPARESRAGARS